MKKTLIILSVWFLCMAGPVLSGGFRDQSLDSAVDSPAPATSTSSSESVPAGLVMAPVTKSSASSAAGQILRRSEDLFARLNIEHDLSGVSAIRRRPLPFYLWGALIALWIAGAFWAKMKVSKFQNPKLSPPLKDLPPDFFFPFIISRRAGLQGCTYNVLSRQKQQLLAAFNSEHEIFLVGSVYAGLFFHISWSLFAFVGMEDLVPNALLSLPGGWLWASAPEIFFVVPFIAGLFIYSSKKQSLRLYDSQSCFLMEAQEDGDDCLIRGDQGEEIARLKKKVGLPATTWDFVNGENKVVFTIKDDYPGSHILRKIFGRLGGILRSRYGILAAGRRAGFVFLDPASADRFQIHLDFDFAGLAQPAQMLVSVLYIISKEKDPIYPSLF
jgi:hypothetical protein